MSVLEALNKAYKRLADRGDVPPFGYSNEKIGFLIALAEDGAPVGPPIDLRDGEGKRLLPRLCWIAHARRRDLARFDGSRDRASRCSSPASWQLRRRSGLARSPSH